nr:unnamed protein product [Naegleria fowleri]
MKITNTDEPQFFSSSSFSWNPYDRDYFLFADSIDETTKSQYTEKLIKHGARVVRSNVESFIRVLMYAKTHRPSIGPSFDFKSLLKNGKPESECRNDLTEEENRVLTVQRNGMTTFEMENSALVLICTREDLLHPSPLLKLFRAFTNCLDSTHGIMASIDFIDLYLVKNSSVHSVALDPQNHFRFAYPFDFNSSVFLLYESEESKKKMEEFFKHMQVKILDLEHFGSSKISEEDDDQSMITHDEKSNDDIHEKYEKCEKHDNDEKKKHDDHEKYDHEKSDDDHEKKHDHDEKDDHIVPHFYTPIHIYKCVTVVSDNFFTLKKPTDLTLQETTILHFATRNPLYKFSSVLEAFSQGKRCHFNDTLQCCMELQQSNLLNYIHDFPIYETRKRTRHLIENVQLYVESNQSMMKELQSHFANSSQDPSSNSSFIISPLLPQDMIVHILKFLSLQELLEFRLVNNLANMMCLQDILWKEICMRESKHYSFLHPLLTTTTTTTNIHSMKSSTVMNSSNSGNNSGNNNSSNNSGNNNSNSTTLTRIPYYVIYRNYIHPLLVDYKIIHRLLLPNPMMDTTTTTTDKNSSSTTVDTIDATGQTTTTTTTTAHTSSAGSSNNNMTDLDEYLDNDDHEHEDDEYIDNDDHEHDIPLNDDQDHTEYSLDDSVILENKLKSCITSALFIDTKLVLDKSIPIGSTKMCGNIDLPCSTISYGNINILQNMKLVLQLNIDEMKQNDDEIALSLFNFQKRTCHLFPSTGILYLLCNPKTNEGLVLHYEGNIQTLKRIGELEYSFQVKFYEALSLTRKSEYYWTRNVFEFQSLFHMMDRMEDFDQKLSQFIHAPFCLGEPHKLFGTLPMFTMDQWFSEDEHYTQIHRNAFLDVNSLLIALFQISQACEDGSTFLKPLPNASQGLKCAQIALDRESVGQVPSS